MIKKVVFFIFFSSLCLCLPVSLKRLTQGFHIQKMKLEAQFNSEWETDSLSGGDWDLLMRILDQPFYYLDRGAQSYVFVSKDGDYVIKLFRFDQGRNPIRKIFRKKNKKQAEKTFRLFSACRLAYTEARSETELLYLHLNPTENHLPTVALRGPLGRSFSIPLDSYRFALQKKAEPFEKALLKALSLGNLERHIDSLTDLLLERTGKKIANSDGNLFRNFGFIGSRAVEIDFGNYAYSEELISPLAQKKEISRFTLSLRSWLKEHAPESVAYLDRKMECLDVSSSL